MDERAVGRAAVWVGEWVNRLVIMVSTICIGG